MLDFLVTVCHACFPLRGREKKTERGGIQNTRGQYTRKSDGSKKTERLRERATDRNLCQIEDNDKTEAETRKKLVYNKSGQIWNRFISVCLLLSLDGWTTDQGYDHRRLEAWPCLPHSHTTKCSRYNEAALVLITFKENTDAQGNLNTDFCT